MTIFPQPWFPAYVPAEPGISHPSKPDRRGQRHSRTGYKMSRFKQERIREEKALGEELRLRLQ